MSQPHSTPNSCHTKCPINTLLTQGSAHSTPSQLPKCWRFPPGPPVQAGLCGGPQTAHNPTETRHPSTSSPAHLSAACAHRRFLLRLPQGNSSRNTHRIYPELSQTPYSHCKSSRAFFEGGFSWCVVFFFRTRISSTALSSQEFRGSRAQCFRTTPHLPRNNPEKQKKKNQHQLKKHPKNPDSEDN